MFILASIQEDYSLFGLHRIIYSLLTVEDHGEE